MPDPQTLHVACPHCRTLNRIPAERAAERPTCGRCKQPLFVGMPVVLDQAAFEAHVGRSELPLLVDFWAAWCGPCRSMAPQFEAAAAELEPAVRLAKLDTEAEPAMAARFGIRSLPTLILLQRGREVARVSGALPRAEIVRWTRHALGDG